MASATNVDAASGGDSSGTVCLVVPGSSGSRCSPDVNPMHPGQVNCLPSQPTTGKIFQRAFNSRRCAMTCGQVTTTLFNLSWRDSKPCPADSDSEFRDSAANAVCEPRLAVCQSLVVGQSRSALSTMGGKRRLQIKLFMQNKTDTQKAAGRTT